jgi:SAM-dependent methyltransferase
MRQDGYARLSSTGASNDRLELQAEGEQISSLVAALPLDGTRRVLEVGCGTGVLTRELARRLPSADVIGIDLSKRHVAFANRAAARAGLGRVRFAQGDGCDPPAEFLSAFDVVLARYVFMYAIADGSAANLLSGMIRCLRPGGRLLLIEADINFGTTMHPAPGSQLAATMRKVVRYYRARGGIEWRAGIRLYDLLVRQGLNGVDVRLIEGRIIQGGRPGSLVDHDGRDLETLIGPAIGQAPSGLAVRSLAAQWRATLADVGGFVYTPIFMASWIRPPQQTEGRDVPRC